MNPRFLLLVVGVLVCAGLVVFLWESPPAGPVDGDPGASGPRAGARAGTASLEGTRPDIGTKRTKEPERRETHAFDTAGRDPSAPRVAPDFDGRTARLTGRVTRGQAGVAARVVIVAGFNRDEERASPSGHFAFDALHPGFARLEIHEQNVQVATRDVVVRTRVPGDHRIDLTAGVLLRGVVVGPDGDAQPGIEVLGDQGRTVTGSDGAFAITVASDSSVRFAGRGFARKEVRAWRGGEQTIRLARGGALEVTFAADSAVDDAVHVYAVPADDRAALHPWNRLLPLIARPGQPLRVDGLPPQRLKVFALGVRGVAPRVEAHVKSGETARVELRVAPLPVLRGEVVDADGEPLSGVKVRYELPNAREVTELLLDKALRFRRSLPFAIAPCAQQTVQTDAAGRFAVAVPPTRRTKGVVTVAVGARAPVREQVPQDARSLRIRVPR